MTNKRSEHSLKYILYMYVQSLYRFSNEDVFIAVLWKFLMTAECEILMMRVIRMAI